MQSPIIAALMWTEVRCCCQAGIAASCHADAENVPVAPWYKTKTTSKSQASSCAFCLRQGFGDVYKGPLRLNTYPHITPVEWFENKRPASSCFDISISSINWTIGKLGMYCLWGNQGRQKEHQGRCTMHAGGPAHLCYQAE